MQDNAVGAGVGELLAREHDERDFGPYGERVAPSAEPSPVSPPPFEIPPADWEAEERELAEPEPQPEPEPEPEPEPAASLKVEIAAPPWAEPEKPHSGQRGQKARRRRRRARRRQAGP
jgi:hypothetical protein